MNFGGNTAMVTGGGSGIGEETALQFAHEGVNVVIADIDSEGGQNTVSKIETETDADATFVEASVTDSNQVEKVISTAVQEYGSLDYGFNNAGIDSRQAPTAEIDEDSWRQVIDVNLTGVWQCMRHEIRQMQTQKTGGAIVNASSIMGKVGFENAPGYTAAKHGVLGLTKTAALENSTESIRVNAVCPGFVETPMLQETRDLDDDAIRVETESYHPIKRLGQPEEIANAVLWLCSDGASFMTGESIGVDGGYLSQ